VADNLTTQTTVSTVPSGSKIATRQVTYSGDASVHIAPVGLVEFSGTDDAKTVTDVAIGAITGALTETAPASDTASSGLNGRLQRIAQRITSLIALLPVSLGQKTKANALAVTLASDEDIMHTEDSAHASTDKGVAVMGVRKDVPASLPSADGEYTLPIFDALNRLYIYEGDTPSVNASFTRPANTTTYAAGDAVTNSTSAPVKITFTGVTPLPAGSNEVVGAILIDGANQTLKGQFELWLFDASVTPDNDNALFTPTDAELATLIGVIPLNAYYVGDATAGADGNVIFPVQGLSLPLKCTGSLQDIYGLLVVRNAYVPVSAEVFEFRLIFKRPKA